MKRPHTKEFLSQKLRNDDIPIHLHYKSSGHVWVIVVSPRSRGQMACGTDRCIVIREGKRSGQHVQALVEGQEALAGKVESSAGYQ